jgi:hypothetical protein
MRGKLRPFIIGWVSAMVGYIIAGIIIKVVG